MKFLQFGEGTRHFRIAASRQARAGRQGSAARDNLQWLTGRRLITSLTMYYILN